MDTRTTPVLVRVLPIGWMILLIACGGREAQTQQPTASLLATAAPTEISASATDLPSESPVPPEPTLEASAQPSTVTPAPSSRPPAAAGNEIAVAQADGTVVLLSGMTRESISSATPTEPPQEMWDCDSTIGLEWSPDGHRLALSNGVWTFGSTIDKRVLSPFWGWNHRWSSDSQRLAWIISAEEDYDMLMAGAPDGDNAKEVGGGHWSYTGRVEWSPDGRLLIGGPQIQAGFENADPATLPEERGKNATWSPDGKQLIWTSANNDEKTVLLSVVQWDGKQQRDLTTITLARAAPGEDSIWWGDPGMNPPRLHWLPDGSGILLPIAGIGLKDGSSTWLIRLDGSEPESMPYLLCDLAPDGQRMIARTEQATLAVIELAGGTVERDLGPGLNAAWRPVPQGPPPAAPLAEKSPRLAASASSQESSEVKELQQRLSERGYDVGEIDGIYGPRTEAAVRQFQEQNGITIDGIVGPETWASLRLPGSAQP